MGMAVLGAVRGILASPRGASPDAVWFSAFGLVLGPAPLLGLAVLSVLPGLYAARKAGPAALLARAVHAALFAFVYYAHTIPALWCFFLPNLLPRLTRPVARRASVTVVAFLPALALVALSVAAWYRGFTHGSFVSAPEAGVALLAAGLLFVGRPGPDAPRFKKMRRLAR
jgi:hypothetical protein